MADIFEISSFLNMRASSASQISTAVRDKKFQIGEHQSLTMFFHLKKIFWIQTYYYY